MDKNNLDLKSASHKKKIIISGIILAFLIFISIISLVINNQPKYNPEKEVIHFNNTQLNQTDDGEDSDSNWDLVGIPFWWWLIGFLIWRVFVEWKR